MEQTSGQRLTQEMDIGLQVQQAHKAFIGFTDADAQALRDMLPVIRRRADQIVDRFYENIQQYPELVEIVRKAGSSIERLRSAQKQYLLELFEGRYDAAYFERRLRIGVVHNRIGLTPRWYIGSYSVYTQVIVPLITRRYWLRPGRRRKALLAFNKIIALDTQLAMETYIHGLMGDLKGISMSKVEIEQTVAAYTAGIEKVAGGDLRERFAVTGEDDLSVLGAHLNGMVESLARMAGQIRETSSTIGVTLTEMQSAIAAQSSGAAQQAAAINQNSTTLREIRATTGQTLDKAQSLGQLAERTREQGETGLRVVEEVVQSMRGIRAGMEGIAQTILALSEQTQQIREINDVVTGLAQQSKMLALNASIEAAKAGEAGKGFAVVAAEVKDLAEQSQQSTAQVQRILQDIRSATDRAVMATEEGTKGADAGAEMVEQAGTTMEQLAEVIRQTSIATQQIVAAVRQEVAGIDQLSTAMEEINKVTGQFVTSTRQTQQAADALQSAADTLTTGVTAYKL